MLVGRRAELDFKPNLGQVRSFQYLHCSLVRSTLTHAGQLACAMSDSRTNLDAGT